MKDKYYRHLELLSKFNTNNLRAPVVLVAPLDWGLGHATRCIPIINHLLSLGCEVIVASSGMQKILLEQAFPLIQFADIKGYNLRFGEGKWRTTFKILASIPKILTRINDEKKWLTAFTAQKKVDLIISDNRFGFYGHTIPSIFITHQLCIQSPFGSMSAKVLQYFNYWFINKFTRCWIPDNKLEPNLAGVLSHPAKFPKKPVSYIGPLSRFERQDGVHIELDILVIISGPEPQRSRFEQLILSQLPFAEKKIVLVRGIPSGSHENHGKTAGVAIYDHLPAEDLNRLVLQADVIISRSGYSTIMDLLPLGKRCVFIPTPGQTEQEYLADYLYGQQLCISFQQNKFSLAEAWEKINKTTLKKYEGDMSNYKEVIEETLHTLVYSTVHNNL